MSKNDTASPAPPARRPAYQPERQEMLAMLLATGRFTTKQISELSGFSPSHIRTIRNSPIFKGLIQKYQQTIYHSIVDATLADILSDAPDNFKFLKDVRDGEVSDDAQSLGVRTRAAMALFDRQVPKRLDDGKESGVKIVINADLKDRFDSADKELEEFGAIEVEAEEVD